MQGCHMRSTYCWRMCTEPELPGPSLSYSGRLGCYKYHDKIPTSTKFAIYDAKNTNVGLETTGFLTNNQLRRLETISIINQVLIA